MFTQLKKVFPSLIKIGNQTNSSTLSSEYRWFTLDDNELIGIDKGELTKKDSSILASFLQPYEIDLPTYTNNEKCWHQVIHNDTEIDMKLDKGFRFTYFSFQPNQIDPAIFKEAVNELSLREISILWENSHQGIIIEEQHTASEQLIFEQIINTLMSDLYVKIKLFIGPYMTNTAQAQHYYRKLLDAANIAFKHTKKDILTYTESIPFIIIDGIQTDLQKDITQDLLQEFIDDSDMLKTLEIFFQSNLNVTLASKALYMHRNSLQYRLDKFTDKTGINLQNFSEAQAVYMALLMNKQQHL